MIDAPTLAARAQERNCARRRAMPARCDEAQLEVEFAQVYLTHDRMLAAQGTLDRGELVARACGLLSAHALVRARAAERTDPYVLVDDLQDPHARRRCVVTLLVGEGAEVLAAADENRRPSPAATPLTPGNVAALLQAPIPTVSVCHSSRVAATLPPRVLAAAQARAARSGTQAGDAPACEGGNAETRDGEVRFWRAASERAQAQAAAADIERLLARGTTAGGGVAILVRSVRREGRAIAAALTERAIPHRVIGAADFFNARRCATCSRGCAC